jgi:hypothetical protein
MRPTMQSIFQSLLAASDGRLAVYSLLAAGAVGIVIKVLIR